MTLLQSWPKHTLNVPDLAHSSSWNNVAIRIRWVAQIHYTTRTKMKPTNIVEGHLLECLQDLPAGLFIRAFNWFPYQNFTTCMIRVWIITIDGLHECADPLPKNVLMQKSHADNLAARKIHGKTYSGKRRQVIESYIQLNIINPQRKHIFARVGTLSTRCGLQSHSLSRI